MQLTKASLCGLLLEDGEEDLAALIAQSGLPDILDTARDAAVLAEIGLDGDELTSLLPAVGAAPGTVGAHDEERATAFKHTISERWAELVGVWIGRYPPVDTTPPDSGPPATGGPEQTSLRLPSGKGPRPHV